MIFQMRLTLTQIVSFRSNELEKRSGFPQREDEMNKTTKTSVETTVYHPFVPRKLVETGRGQHASHEPVRSGQTSPHHHNTLCVLSMRREGLGMRLGFGTTAASASAGDLRRRRQEKRALWYTEFDNNCGHSTVLHFVLMLC
jgi:hypothetical protein